jgi:uncharacterized UPF0160 family protein
MATEFKKLRTYDKSEDAADEGIDTSSTCITEPILTSFPANMPSAAAIKKMKFNVFQQERQIPLSHQQKDAKRKTLKRIVKAEYKGIKYEAKSHASEAVGHLQASDYYIGLFDTVKNQVHAIKIDSALQFQ